VSKGTSDTKAFDLLEAKSFEIPNFSDLLYESVGSEISPEEQRREEEYNLFSRELKSLFGEEKFNRFASYIASVSAFQLLTEESSPLYEMINSVLSDMHRETEQFQRNISDQVRKLKLENKELRQNAGHLASELNTTNMSLAAVRKRLKDDSIKNDLDECQKIRNKKGNLSDLEQLVLRLGEAIKDSLCSTRRH